MPRIPTYTAGKLASEQTGVGSADKSGMIISEAVTNLAGKVFGVAEDVLTKQKNLLQQSELVKLTSEYESRSAVLGAEVRKNNLLSPDEAAKQLQEEQQGLLTEFKSRIKDPDLMLRFDAAATNANFGESGKTQLWAFQENNKLIQKNLIDRGQADIARAAQTDNLDEVLGLAMKMDADRKTYYSAWGDALEGGKAVDTLQEALFQAYFTEQMSKGNAWKALRELNDPRLGATEYRWAGGETQQSNGFVNPTKLLTWRRSLEANLLKTKDDAATLSLLNAVESGMNLDELEKKPLSTLAEEINGLTFEIGKTEKLVEEGQVSPKQVEAMKKLQSLYQTMYDRKVSLANDQIVADPAVEAEIGAAFTNLFKWQGGQRKNIRGTLEDIYNFQKQLEDARPNIAPAKYEAWQRMVRQSFLADIQNERNNRFGVKQAFEFGPIKLGDIVAKDKSALAASTALQKTLGGFIKRYGDVDKPQHVYDSLLFFMDELDEAGRLGDASSLLAKPETLETMMSNAERKATLQAQGLPLYMQAKDILTRGGKKWRITGFEDGEVTVEEARE